MNKQIDQYDYQAEQESNAIAKSFKPKRGFSTRLRRYYYNDGFKFNTGARHRPIGRNQ